MKRPFLKLAFASNDKINFVDKHFGDANYFILYEMSDKKLNFIETIENNSKEEKTHADPKKAKSISKILKEQDVNVLVGKAFGGNILRMKRNFVCIKCDFVRIEESFETLLKNFDKILLELQKGENRDYLVL